MQIYSFHGKTPSLIRILTDLLASKDVSTKLPDILPYLIRSEPVCRRSTLKRSVGVPTDCQRNESVLKRRIVIEIRTILLRGNNKLMGYACTTIKGKHATIMYESPESKQTFLLLREHTMNNKNLGTLFQIE